MTPIVYNFISDFRKNENKAFEYLYSNYKKPFIDSMLSSNSGLNEAQALDLFQDSILVLYDKVLQEKLLELKNPKAYILRIGQLLAYERFREVRKQRDLKGELLNQPVTVEIDFKLFNEIKSDKSIADKALANLGERCRQILIDYYYKNLSFNEIATKHNYSNGNTVKSQKSKCIKQIRNFNYES